MPDIYMMCGAAGSGKSTVGAMVSNATGGLLLVVDEVRREVGFGEKDVDVLYSRNQTERVYAQLMDRLIGSLNDGNDRSIVLDGTFLTRHLRRRPRELAIEHGARLIAVVCSANHYTKLERLLQRNEDSPPGTNWQEVLAKHSAVFERVRPEEADIVCCVTNDGNKCQLANAVTELLSRVRT